MGPLTDHRMVPALLVILIAALGTELRVHDLSGQLPISDEWHALHAAATCSYGTLAGLMTAGATSIPMNLYDKLLLGTVGWSEWTIRMPSLLAGIALLLAVPALVFRLLGARVALVACGLVAVSPFLVFFSRYARPYSLAVLLAFVGAMSCHRWFVSGRRGWAVVFALCGAVAAWLHPVELRMVALPLGFYLVVALVRRVRSGAPRPAVGPAALVLAGVSALVVLAVLLLPVLLGERERLFGILGRHAPTAATLAGAAELLAGTADGWLLGLLAALLVVGALTLLRRDRLLAGMFATVVVGVVAVVLVTRPHRSNLPIVFARYALPILPFCAVILAAGVDEVLRRVERSLLLGRVGTHAVATLAILLLLAVLLHRGPLPSLYHQGVNSYTNHKAFQSSYGWIDDEAGHLARYRRTMLGDAVETALATSAFYVSLRDEPGDEAIIEYPQPVGDVASFHGAHQRGHGRRVLGGYVPSVPPDARSARPGFVNAFGDIDQVLAEVADPAALRFASLIDITDVQAVRESEARYLVVHHSPALEMKGVRSLRRDRTSRLEPMIVRYGEPVLVDDWVAVFDLASR